MDGDGLDVIIYIVPKRSSGQKKLLETDSKRKIKQAVKVCVNIYEGYG